jgi:mannosyltransferase OCH1-like enzyme
MGYSADKYGIHFKYPSLSEYRPAMSNAWDYLFQARPNNAGNSEASPRSPSWEAVLQHLELASPAFTADNDDDLPRKIYTTSKGLVPDYADEFEGWKKLSPDWDVVNYDDEKTLKWLKRTLPAENGQNEAKLIHEFASLTKGVLKGEWHGKCGVGSCHCR